MSKGRRANCAESEQSIHTYWQLELVAKVSGKNDLQRFRG
jgi:hypothetical protein